MNKNKSLLPLPNASYQALMTLGCPIQHRQQIIMAIYHHAVATLPTEQYNHIISLKIHVKKSDVTNIWLTAKQLPPLEHLRNILIIQITQAVANGIQSILDSISYYRYFTPPHAVNYRSWLDGAVIDKIKILAQEKKQTISHSIEEILLAWHAPCPMQISTTGKNKRYQVVYLSGAISHWAAQKNITKVDSKVINAILQHTLQGKND